MAKTFSEIQVRLNGNIAGLTAALDKASKDLNKFNFDVKKIAGAIGIGFGAQQIFEFTKEIVNLSGKAEGVALAFNKLPNSIGLINELKVVTKGTLSEFELMQRTVQAFNLGIGLREFPKLLEFATVRAQQTGEELDYIVQSLVEGIGRKSVLKLDNLGISAERLRKKLNGVSLEASTIAEVTRAFGEIADEELKNMGSLAETTATKVAKLSSAWTEFKIALGGVAGTIAEPAVDSLTKLFKVLSSDKIGFLEKLGVAIGGFTQAAPGVSNIDVSYYKILAEDAEQVEIANAGAGAATAYFNEQLKNGKSIQQASFISLENLNKVIADYNKEIKKEESFKNFPYAERLRNNLKLLKEAWISTNNSLVKDSKAQQVTDETKKQEDALNALIEKLRQYDQILKKFKVGEAKEAVKLIADVTTGKLLRPTNFADQAGILAVQQRLLPETKGPQTVEQLFGKNAAEQIKAIGDQAELAVLKMNKLANSSILVGNAFKDAASVGISAFVSGLSDVAQGTESFGALFLKSIASFMKSFSAALVAIGTAQIAAGFYGQGVKNIAAASALSVAAGLTERAASRNLSSSASNGAYSGNTSLAYNNSGQNITITGRLVGSGRDLVAVIENTYFDNQMRKGG